MTTQTEPQTTTWVIDKAHSEIEFAVKHMMISTVKGHFAEFSGTIVEDTADPSRSSVDVTIEVASITTREAKRDEHLRSSDFFLAEQHPTITFKSTSISVQGADHVSVTGDLTIRGTTRPVTLDVSRTGSGANPWGQQVTGFTATAQINRKDFGLTYNMALEAGGVLVGETVKISIEVEATKQA